MATLNASLNLREEVPVNIVKGANLEKTMNDLFKNFEAGEQRNAELVNRFFDQTYFRGEESLLNKLTEIKPDITFNDIGNEGINLATLQYDNQLYDFMYCINKITDDEIKKALIKEIHDKVQTKLGTIPAYGDFNNPNKCGIPGNTDVLGYFQKVVNYLTGKEGNGGTKKTIKILEGINISNNDLNNILLTVGRGIPAGVNLIDPSIHADTKNAFDTLLSFEIGKEADRTTNIAKDISDKLEGLFSNTFPAINTIISENDEYKYDENKLTKKYPEYQGELQAIKDDSNLSDKDKVNQINNLKWKYYLKYLKTKNSKIGNALEQLYNNDFDYSKLESGLLKNYMDTVVDTRVRILFDSGLKDIIKVDFSNIDSFKNFCKDLADPTKNNISLGNVNLVPGGIVNIPIKKSIVEGKHLRLKDITEFGGTEKSYDALPIRYEISKSDIDNLNITIEDKTMLLNFLSRFSETDKYIIEGESIGMLIYLFFVINSKTPMSQFNSDEQKKIQDLFGKAKNETKDGEGEDNNGEDNNGEDKKNKDGNNDNENKAGEDHNEDKEVTEEYTPEKFKEDIEKLGPGKFENGSEIWLPMGSSEIPGGGYQWMKIKISDIDMKKGKFKGTVSGGELKFSDKYEGKSKEFKMNKNFYEDLEKISKDSNKIWLLPDPNKSDFNSFMENLNGNLGTDKLSFPTTGVIRTGNKFKQKVTDENGKEKEIEVKYFGASEDDKSTYKIEYNPNKKHFTVLSTYNGEEKGKDGKSEKKRFSYKRDMDWNNFLIFFNQKGLIPQTEEQSKSAISRQDQDFKMQNGGHWKLNWFSISNIKNVFKTITGNIKKKIDDYNKKQDEKLQEILIGDRGIYSKLAGVLGFIPSMKEGLGELEKEYYNERDNRTWKKIEKYYKDFCADYDLPDTFDQEPPHIKIQGKGSLKNQILARVANATDKMGDPGIYQAAGLLLANIEKGGGPYRGLSGLENKGIRIRALLGKAHYEQFLRDKQKCIDAFSTEENKDKLQDALANSEMTYIINNVYGKDGGLLFGSHESRGLPGNTEKTNYIENPSKKILSEQFAKKLDDLTKDNFTKDGVIGKMPKHNYFEKAENDFYRLIKSSRFSGAMSELEGMISLARTDAQVYATKKCYLILMLSGILDFNGNKGLRKLAYTQGKTFGFAPAMLAKNIGHSEEIASLLDDFSGGDFSKHVTSYCHKKDLLKGETDIKNLINQVNDRFNLEKMKEFDDYVESIPGRDWKGKSKALQKLQENLTDYDNENPDDIVLKNAKLINSAGLNASADAVSTRLRIENGEFKGKDQDEKKDIKDFRKSCSTKIRKATGNLDGEGGADRANKMLDKYLGWFGISGDSKQDIYKRINTAYKYKDKIEASGKSDGKGKYCEIIHKKEPVTNKEGKTIEMDIPLGKIYDDDVKKILRYGLEGFVRTHRLGSQQLPTELKTALDNFQEFFEKAFYNGYFNDISSKINTKPDRFVLGGRQTYEKIKQKENVVAKDDDDNETVSSTDFENLDWKKKRPILRRIFDRDIYKNDDINSMRQSLKRHGVSLPYNERGLFNDISDRIEELQECL